MRNLSVIKGLYQGNGVTRRFAIPFEYNDTAQIFVTITTYDEGDYTYRVLDSTEYTIDEDSVEIVYPKTVDDEPIPSTQYLTVWRDTDLLQLMDLTNQGAAWPDSIEASLDKLHQIVQELAEGLSRSLKVDIGDPQTPDEKLVAIQDYVLAAAESSRSASASAVSANQAAEAAATSEANAAESERIAGGYADTATAAAGRAEDSAISARAYNAPDYDNETTYQAGEVVTYTDGNSYRALQETTGNEPPNIIYWQKVTDYVGDDFFEVDEYGYIVPMDSPSHSRYWRVDQNGYIVPIEGGDGGYRPDTRQLSAEYLNVTNEGYVKHLRADDVNAQDLSATGNVTAGMVTTPQANVTTLTANAVNAGTLTADDIIAKGPIVDVRAFGAVGDGVTDDTAAIQNVLDSHNVIYIPQGEYFITSTLVIKNSNTKIFGEGKSSKLIKSKDNAILLSASSGLSNIVIKSLYFGVEESTPSYTQAKQLVAINNCSFIDVIDCEFNSYNGEGKQTLFGHLQTSSSDDVLVQNCSFFGSYGQCCGAQDGVGDGVHGKRQRFINNLLSGFVDTGIGVWTNASDVLIDGNVFLGNNDTSLNYDGVSIDLAGGTNVLVSNNLFIGGNKGVRCLHSLTYYNKNISIENNIFKNQVKITEPAHGIKVYDNPTVAIKNNVITNDSKDETIGIYIGILSNNDVNGEKIGLNFPIQGNKFIGMYQALNFDCGGGLAISADITDNIFSDVDTVLQRNTIASDDRLLLYIENNTVVNETAPLYAKGIAYPVGEPIIIAENNTSTETSDTTEKTAVSTYIRGGAHRFDIYVTEYGAYDAEAKIKDSSGNVIYSLVFGEKTNFLVSFYLFFPKADTYSVTIAKVGAGPFTGAAAIDSVHVFKYL